jgi:putative membrane protein
MKHTFHLLAGLLLAGTVTITSCQEQPKDSKEIAEESNEAKKDTRASEKDAQFVVDVVASNYAEVELAKAAQQKSTNSEIKDIAAMLEADHTALIGQLKDYAGKTNISVPSAPTPEAQKDAQDLIENNKKEMEFDKKWTNVLIDKHEQTISKLERDSNDVADPALQSIIGQALPKVRMHRDKLMQIKDKLK